VHPVGSYCIGIILVSPQVYIDEDVMGGFKVSRAFPNSRDNDEWVRSSEFGRYMKKSFVFITRQRSRSDYSRNIQLRAK